MPPRVWTVFAAYVLLGVATFAAVIATGLTCAWRQTHEPRFLALLDAAAAYEQTPLGFIVCRLPAHIVLLAATLWLGWRSPEPCRRRLGMTPCSWPPGHYVAAVAASLAPLTVSLLLTASCAPVFAPDPFFDRFTWPTAAAYLAYVTLGPGLAEELFFRGYMQRRLLQRWSPAAALLTTAVLFTVAHGVTPATLLRVFPVALWLGVLAWRSGSIWPGCICHAWLNGVWSGWAIGCRLTGVDPALTVPFAACVAVCVVLCLISTWEALRDAAPEGGGAGGRRRAGAASRSGAVLRVPQRAVAAIAAARALAARRREMTPQRGCGAFTEPRPSGSELLRALNSERAP